VFAVIADAIAGDISIAIAIDVGVGVGATAGQNADLVFESCSTA
jgi:hypothetical protein